MVKCKTSLWLNLATTCTYINVATFLLQLYFVHNDLTFKVNKDVVIVIIIVIIINFGRYTATAIKITKKCSHRFSETPVYNA